MINFGKKILSQFTVENIKTKAIESAFFAKSGVYFLESYPLLYIDQWIQTGKFKRDKVGLSEKEMLEEVTALVQSDVDNIRSGLYPLSVVRIENPITHMKTLFKVYKDSIKVSKNKKNKKSKVFSEKAKEKTKDLPDYYTRNFHFQTDGYLSAESAEIYDHQVEILFRGTADVMRRLILRPMVSRLNSDERLQILEVGSGTGVSTFPLAKTFSKSRIKAIDLSEDYVDFCKKEYSNLSQVSFAVGMGEDLQNIKDNSIDAWCSTFMFHELPKDIREKTLKEAFRVLKPGGGVFLVDSIQAHDRPDFKEILDLFPQNFHEPFFKNYTQTSLEGLFEAAGFVDIGTDLGFVSKVCYAAKPA